MASAYKLLTTWNQRLDRLPYLIAGCTLMAIKAGMDWVLATLVFGMPWSPVSYLIWPDNRALGLFELTGSDRIFVLVMLAVSLPFIWTGVKLTHHRLHSAQLSGWLVLLFFVPIVNLFLFLVLMIVPTRLAPAGPLVAVAASREDLLRQEFRVHSQKSIRDGFLAIVVSVPLTVAFVWFGASYLQNYGWGLFVGAPFFLGMFPVLIYCRLGAHTLLSSLGVAFAAFFLAGGALLVLAMEGAVCPIMAVPLAFPVTMLGGLVGFAIRNAARQLQETSGLYLVLTLALPGLLAAESVETREPELRAVRTSLIVHASVDRVWERVVEFPPLPPPTEWMFRAGVAYPMRAEIHGQGVGAVRHCIFSTGTFVEPIVVWDPPRLLQFDVTEQPEPMRELSPYSIHPPHLQNYLICSRGQFRLEPIDENCTLLEGTTWYSNRMWPAAYWHLWSDAIIHRIHLRVLEHIRIQSEEKAAGSRRK